jgi:hypothetical protein
MEIIVRHLQNISKSSNDHCSELHYLPQESLKPIRLRNCQAPDKSKPNHGDHSKAFTKYLKKFLMTIAYIIVRHQQKISRISYDHCAD